jgi:hypothetical protein
MIWWQPINHEGIASMPSSITALKAPEPAILITHLHHHIAL